MDYNQYNHSSQNMSYTTASLGNSRSYSQHNGSNQKQTLENPAINPQNLRRNSIQRKIIEQQLRQAETTQSVNQAFNSVRPITQGHLAAPTMPSRKLSASSPNLTLIPETDQMLSPPLHYPSQQRSSSPMRLDRSHSPRMTPYPVSPAGSPYVLSPATSTTHLSDYGSTTSIPIPVPVDLMSGMRLSSPQPSYLLNGSPNQRPSFLQLTDNQQHQQRRSGSSSNIINGSCLQAHYDTNSLGMYNSPCTHAGQSVPNAQDESTGLERELEVLLEEILHGKSDVLSNSLSSSNLASYQNGFNQGYNSYGETTGSANYNSFAHSQPSNTIHCGIQFPLPDEEVSPYTDDTPACGMRWNPQGQQNFIQSNGSQQVPMNSRPDHRSNTQKSNELKIETYGRPRVASMPSMKMRTTETNRIALCGSTVVDRKLKMVEHPVCEDKCSVPTIIITPDGGFGCYPTKPESMDSNNCDDLISFLSNEQFWNGSNGTGLPVEPISPADLPLTEYQERFLLADSFARQELGLDSEL